MKLLGLFAGICLAGLLSLLAAWFYVQNWFVTPLNIPEQGYTYDLKQGHSLSHLANDLGNEEILNHPRLLRLYARFDETAKIHAGEYFFPVGTTPKELLLKLKSGDVILYQVTFVEGWTVKQVLASMEKLTTVRHLLSGRTEQEHFE